MVSAQMLHVWCSGRASVLVDGPVLNVQPILMNALRIRVHEAQRAQIVCSHTHVFVVQATQASIAK
jgi:hypothetical protein